MLKCSQCDQEFTRKDTMTRHKKEIHRLANVNHHYSENNCIDQRAHYIRPYQCINCGKKFKRNYNLERHRRMAHEKKEAMKNLECIECKNMFSDKKSLKHHVLETHVNKMYKCDKCEKIFTKQSNQHRHKMTIVGIKKKSNCEKCGKHFKRDDNLLRHINTCDVTN